MLCSDVKVGMFVHITDCFEGHELSENAEENIAQVVEVNQYPPEGYEVYLRFINLEDGTFHYQYPARFLEPLNQPAEALEKELFSASVLIKRFFNK